MISHLIRDVSRWEPLGTRMDESRLPSAEQAVERVLPFRAHLANRLPKRFHPFRGCQRPSIAGGRLPQRWQDARGPFRSVSDWRSHGWFLLLGRKADLLVHTEG
jgi:hypothetical protein